MTGKIDFLAGALLGFVVALYGVLLFYGYLTSFESLRLWLSNWQTLLSTIVAILAAFAAVWAIRIQVEQSDEHRRQEVRRRNLAARALISQPLSEICEIQTTLAKHFSSIMQTPQVDRPLASYVAPATSPAAIEYLAKCIEDADDNAATDLSILISELQVQKARLRSLNHEHQDTEMVRGLENFTEHALDTVLIYARAQRLLFYARKEDGEYYDTAFRDIILGNCNLMIRSLGIQSRIDARLKTIGGNWLGTM